jgi:KipI family sensor histidine kinase inhibitor
MIEYRLLPAGENGLVVEFGNSISEEINGHVSAFCQAYQAHPIRGVRELVPTFRSVLVCYDCGVISYRMLTWKIKGLLKKCSGSVQSGKRTFVIPVCYGGSYGPDMESVMAHTGLTEEELIRRHSAPDYLIYMLGFLPGFAYLCGLDPALVTPRLKSPRTKIEAGSVGIGGEQTGIYPLDSPGGWQLIGKTPLKVYDAERETPILYQAGDRIRFRPVDEAEFLRISREIDRNTYQYEILEAGV